MKNLIILKIIILSPTGFADIFHYNNVIPGDRAMGLGGAYTAISDDSSGIIYNPAGLAFALNDDLSGSANAFYWKKTVYKRTIGDKSFEETSRGFLPSFVGTVKKFDIFGGLSFGFAIYPGDYESKDQNDLIRMPEADIMSFHRTVNKNSSTLYIGSGIGKRLLPSLSLGLGINLVIVNELEQVYQDAIQKVNVKLSDVGKKKGDVYFSTSENARQHLSVVGIEPHIGFQYALFNSFVFASSARLPFIIKERLTYDGDSSYVYKFSNDTVVKEEDVDRSLEKNLRIGSGKSFKVTPFQDTTSDGFTKASFSLDNSLEKIPYEVRVGMAWFASPIFLLSADISYRNKVKTSLSIYDRMSVINYHLGSEIFILPSIPIRVGFFTNYDARRKVEINKTDQNDHIDYMGASCFVGWSQSNSQISVGGIYQIGNGKAQKIRNSLRVQNVESQSVHLAFSASHTF